MSVEDGTGGAVLQRVLFVLSSMEPLTVKTELKGEGIYNK